MQLPGGFSPLNAIKQAGSALNPTGGLANYDVFSNVGAQRTPQAQPQSSGTYEGAMSAGPDGQISEYRNGQWSVINNPSSTPANAGVALGVNTGSYGGGSTASTFDPNSVAEANDIIAQANDVLGRLGGNRTAAQNSIASTFGNYRTSMQNDYSRNEGDYNQNKLTTTKQNEVAKNNIDRNVATRSNSLSRYLGSRGGGDSQAAYQLAPYAAARTGTQMRNQVNQQYGANLSSLDQTFNRYKGDYTNSMNSLGDQERNANNQSETDFLQQELGARDNLRKGQSALNYAQTGNTAGARALREQALPGLFAILQQIDALSRPQVTPTVKDSTYTAPELSQYTTEGVQDAAGVDPIQADSVSPLYQYLLKKQQEDSNFFGY